MAANPSAPSELLREISQSKDAIVREAVTGNPNTPMEILLELAGEFPEAFFDNPILPLLCLERPDFMKTVPADTAVSLFLREKMPARWELTWPSTLNVPEPLVGFLGIACTFAYVSDASHWCTLP